MMGTRHWHLLYIKVKTQAGTSFQTPLGQAGLQGGDLAGFERLRALPVYQRVRVSVDRTQVTKAAFQLSAVAPSDPEVTVDGVSGQKRNAMEERRHSLQLVMNLSVKLAMAPGICVCRGGAFVEQKAGARSQCAAHTREQV